MSEILGAVIGGCIGVVLLLLYYRVLRQLEDPADISAPTRSHQRFCRDCGKEFITIKEPDGFDPVTGKAHFKSKDECPNYDAAQMARYKSIVPGNIGMYFGQSASDWPDCGERASPTRASLQDPAHIHADPTETRLDCPGCLRVMVANGAISEQMAKDLLRKTA